jgi:pimeloyl-ACP methyl ester carboxylesterase
MKARQSSARHGRDTTTSHVDDTMKRCILVLYRSAIHVGLEWTEDLARITAPGLVLWGEADPFADSRFGARLARANPSALRRAPRLLALVAARAAGCGRAASGALVEVTRPRVRTRVNALRRRWP